jgi:hypothetical protein
MKKLFSVLAFVCVVIGLSINAQAQNLTTVSASNITDINGTKLASGQLCFLITDQQDNPISVSIGGGGQALRRGYCSPVSAGAVTGFTVPNPSATQPSGIYYRVTVKDSSSGLEVLRYTQVSFTGATFNFDNYAPQNLGNAAPLSGNSVTGNLSVTGNVAATGTVNGSNIPAGQINTGAGTTNAIPKYTNGASGVVGNSDLTDDGNTLTIADSLNVTASTGLGTTAGTGGFQVVGGLGTPHANRIYCGDGTGWQCEWAKRTASTDTVEAFLTDSGVFNIATGYRVNGGAPSGNVLRGNGTNFVASTLAASDLSNGTSGSGSVCLTTSCSLTTPSVSSPTTTGTDSGTETLTGKSFGGSGSATPNTNFNRIVVNRGTALTSAKFALSAGWGSTASVGSIVGTDSLFSFIVTAGGTGLATNPSVTITFADGTWTNPPICVFANGPTTGANPTWITLSSSDITSTTLKITANITPIAATYGGSVFCGGR